MGTITLTVPSAGEPVTAASVANPLNTIKNEINGNLDNNNVKESANISWSKISKTNSVLNEIGDIDVTGAATGDILYRNSSAKWARLAIGTDGQILKLASGIPSWAAESTPSATPTGSVLPYTATSAPSGWLLADGAAVSRTTYSDLFDLIGTTFGAGDGSSTFNLPNLKGKVPVGLDAGQSEFDALAETGGAKTHTLTTAEIPSHTHSTTVTSGDGSGNFKGGGVNPAGSASTGASGGGGAHNNLQPYITLTYIIKT